MREVVLYSRLDTHHTILEVWGGSTKHPDSVFILDENGCKETDFENNPLFRREGFRNMYQWLCSVQGSLLFPLRALNNFILDLACECGTLC